MSNVDNGNDNDRNNNRHTHSWIGMEMQRTPKKKKKISCDCNTVWIVTNYIKAKIDKALKTTTHPLLGEEWNFIADIQKNKYW